ncbi:MAG: DUF3108 domain-containing protein [Verrucomicrobia bacterium]|nr:DUF3108 domain-containing protein [Verrucomicrobiota bacterium]
MHYVKAIFFAIAGCAVFGLGLPPARAESAPDSASAPAQAATNRPARNATHPPATLARSDCGQGSVAGGPALWFPVGEQIFYKVQWGVWIVAETKVASEYIEEDGRELLAIRVTTHTKSILSVFYPVDDFIESVVDPVTFLSIRFTKRLSEGRYRLHEITTFDHKARTAHWRHLLKNESKDFAIDANTRDLISFMFYMRSQKFEPNKHYEFRVMADEKLYNLLVESRDIETLNIGNYAKIRSLKLDPEAKFQGLFVRVGKLEVWISDDERCLCVRATAKAPVIGTIRLLIDRVEGPGDDYWTHPGNPNYTQKARNPVEGLAE